MRGDGQKDAGFFTLGFDRSDEVARFWDELVWDLIPMASLVAILICAGSLLNVIIAAAPDFCVVWILKTAVSPKACWR